MPANAFAGLWKPFGDAIRALRQAGDGPIVILTITVVSLVALAARAPPFAVAVVDFVGLAAFFGWHERQHIWKRRADDAAYEALERKDAAAVRRRLRRRLEVEGQEVGRIAAPAEDADDAPVP